MPDRSDDGSPKAGNNLDRLSQEVGAKEARKIRARQAKDRTLWVGVGMFGVIGWSIALPTLLGVGLGFWIDRNWPGSFSWTLALLLAGVTLGALSAWHWVSVESRVIDEQGKESEQ